MKMLLLKDLLKNVNVKNYFLQDCNNGFILIVNFKNNKNNFETKKIINYLKLFNFKYRIIENNLNYISIDIN